MSVLWTATEPSAGSVVIVAPDGSQTSFAAASTTYQPSTTQMPVAYYQYQADITGLVAGNTYQYRVVLDGQTVAGDPVHNSFTTPTTGDLSFLAFGDSGLGTPQELSLVQQMAAETGIGKVIHVGDLAYDSGTFAQFESYYFATNAPLMSRLSFFATPGNHDYETGNGAAFLAGHAAPVGNIPAADVGRYYSYDWGDIHFASVDSNLLPTDAATRMLNWLENDLASTGKYWKIVFLHHTPYPTGFHLGDPICEMVRQNVNPIVERHGVQLVLTGHEHGYERSFPLVANQPVSADKPSTVYVVTGGGGGGLETVGSLPQCALSVQAYHYLRVDIADSQLTVRAIGLGGTSVDMFTVNPPPVITSPGGVLNADFSPAITAGSLVTIFGKNLALHPVTSPTFPVATSNRLGGIAVWANDEPVPVLYVSPTQINVHLPRRISGNVTLRVTTPNGSASVAVMVDSASAEHLVSVGR